LTTCEPKTSTAAGISQTLRLTQIAVTLPMMAASCAKRRMKMSEKILDVLAAIAIGICFAVLLVAWWSS
jgi:hypothetical protein